MSLKRISAVLICGICIAGTVSCKNDHSDKNNKITIEGRPETDTANYTTIRWMDSTFNFGTVKKGKKVKLTYRFQNSGDKPLYITNVQPTCGCTIADYTKEAVLPGKGGTVTTVFDSNHGVPGSVTKTVVVSSNTKNAPNYVLNFKGKIEE